jgi:hypothetical protein
MFRTSEPGVVGKTPQVGSQDQDHRGRIEPVRSYRPFGIDFEGQANCTRGWRDAAMRDSSSRLDKPLERATEQLSP